MKQKASRMARLLYVSHDDSVQKQGSINLRLI